MYDIVTIGDIKLDTFIIIPESSEQCSLKEKNSLLCFDYGKKISVGSFEPQIAGSAANVAVGSSRLGLRSAIFSVMGDDETTDLAFKKLGKEGVDTRFIQIKHNAKSSFSIVLSYRGNRTILAKHEPHIYHLPEIDEPKWVYLSELGEGYETLFKALPSFIKRKKIKLAFNPGAVQLEAGPKLLAPILKVTEVLFVNLEDAQMLTGRKNHTDVEHLIKFIWKMGPNIVVLSNGKEGAYAFDGGKVIHQPAFPAKVVEATGAGDSLGTGFVAALHAELNMKQALAWGCANSASVLGQVGPQAGLLTRARMEKTVKKFANIKSSEM
ncbi:MAG: sugar kinase [bacterium]